MSISNSSISHKGIAMVAVVVATIGLIIASAVVAQKQIQKGLETTNSELLPYVESLGEVESSMSLAHAESMRLILLYMSGVKGGPIDKQKARTNAAVERAVQSLSEARLISRPTDQNSDGPLLRQDLLDRYIEQQAVALKMAEIDASSGRLFYTVADNTFADLIVNLQTTANNARAQATAIGASAQTQGKRATTFFLGSALIGAALTVLVVINILRAIVTPLLTLTDTMRRLSANELDVEITYHHRKDEIGAIAKAIEVFKKNAIRRQILELRNAEVAAKEAVQRETEKLVQVRQDAEKERLKMTALLNQEFGLVIGAARAGDFTKRIATQFADENLDALAQDINSLVETVEDGVSAAQNAVRALAQGLPFGGNAKKFSGDFAEMLGNIDDTSRQIQTQAESLRHIALHDSLTELPNRRYLENLLAEEKLHSAKQKKSFALLHIDLDRFKQINDTLGHATGDSVLKHVANILRRACSESDFTARIGGDEFVVFCAGSPTNQENEQTVQKRAQDIAEHILEQTQLPFEIDGHSVRSGVSVGIAHSGSLAFDPAELLISADLALYEAKNRGRSQWHLFTPDLHLDALNRKTLTDDILRGLDADEFFPFFQPQVDAKTYALVGMEALARWQHPERGILNPVEFISMAEDIGVISRIDQMIARKSVQAVDRMRVEHGLEVPRLSLNFSFAQLRDEQVISSLEALRSPHFKICVELLESVFFDQLTEADEFVIDRITDGGFEIEIDDFGSGHASISGLMRLRPHRLKIDRSIVLPVTELPEHRRLIHAIVEMAHALDIGLIAEGVETMEHANILEGLECQILQGYAFARPLSERDFVAFGINQRQRLAS